MKQELLRVQAAIIRLSVLLFILASRQPAHRSRQHVDKVRKNSAIRGFAGPGVFSLRRVRRRYPQRRPSACLGPAQLCGARHHAPGNRRPALHLAAALCGVGAARYRAQLLQPAGHRLSLGVPGSRPVPGPAWRTVHPGDQRHSQGHSWRFCRP
ncbi:hypothetical protein D3C85_1417740 [compost metagenome]